MGFWKNKCLKQKLLLCFRVEKVTTKDIKLGGIELNKGVRVSIPLYALHQSEEIYPEPEKFDAARMVPYPNYLPFGQAGNNSDSCIGFALVASKFILSKLVRDYKFSGVQESYFNNLFEKGFTRIPHPREIDILVKKRV